MSSYLNGIIGQFHSHQKSYNYLVHDTKEGNRPGFKSQRSKGEGHNDHELLHNG